MFLVTLANQTVQAANQHRVLTSSPNAAAQANTAFMVSVFLGGSLGAFLGPLAYTAGGMRLVALQAFAVMILACTVRALPPAHEGPHRCRRSQPTETGAERSVAVCDGLHV